MPDFSNLSVITASTVASYYARGKQPTDEMLLEAFKLITPSFVSQLEAKVITSTLQGKRGRPPKNLPSRKCVSERISNSIRTDIPEPFKQALAVRLKRSTGLKDAELNLKAQNRINWKIRANFLPELYREIFSHLDDSDYFNHPLIGVMAVPMGSITKSQKAMKMAGGLLAENWGIHTPEYASMMNLISKKKKSTPHL